MGLGEVEEVIGHCQVTEIQLSSVRTIVSRTFKTNHKPLIYESAKWNCQFFSWRFLFFLLLLGMFLSECFLPSGISCFFPLQSVGCVYTYCWPEADNKNTEMPIISKGSSKKILTFPMVSLILSFLTQKSKFSF